MSLSPPSPMSQGTTLSKSTGKCDACFAPEKEEPGLVSFCILIPGGRFEIRGWKLWEEGQRKGPGWSYYSEQKALPVFPRMGKGRVP